MEFLWTATKSCDSFSLALVRSDRSDRSIEMIIISENTSSHDSLTITWSVFDEIITATESSLARAPWKHNKMFFETVFDTRLKCRISNFVWWTLKIFVRGFVDTKKRSDNSAFSISISLPSLCLAFTQRSGNFKVLSCSMDEFFLLPKSALRRAHSDEILISTNWCAPSIHAKEKREEINQRETTTVFDWWIDSQINHDRENIN